MAGFWRLITDDGVTASFGLAADEWMAQHQTPERRPMLRLYTYRSHCALVGRFQHVDTEVDRAFCAAHGIDVCRRPTGGGAILMGEDQLGVALTLPDPGEGGGVPSLRDRLGPFAQAVVEGLRALGVVAAFAGKNDVEVRGRKIAGLGLYHAPGGGVLFHCSLLVDLDIPLMLRVLRTPFEKLADKAVATVAERITTVRRELGRWVSLDEVRAHVAEGFARVFGVTLVPDRFTPEELEGICRLEAEKYRDPQWIDLRQLTPDLTGSARVKTPGGLVEVHLTLVGEAIKVAYIHGDFFAAEGAVAELERLLRWHSAAPEAIARTVGAYFERAGPVLAGVTAEHLATAVQRAVEAARAREGVPYGCFVNP
jgi:lipoate-protein ligase A